MGLLLLSWSFLRSELLWKRKVGVWFLPLTLAVVMWIWTSSILLALMALVLWFGLPLFQATIASRKLRFSYQRKLETASLSLEECPGLHQASQEVREGDFDFMGDYWLKPSPQEQAFRLFQHRTKAISGAVALVRQGPFQLIYRILATRSQDGALWMTWDYPLAYGLEMPPGFNIYRYLDAEDVTELVDQHDAFLELNEVKAGLESDGSASVYALFEEIFQTTMVHNLKVGMLKRADESDEIRYTWKGTFFLLRQVLREVVSA